jgi:hypothetical protein
MIMKVNVDVDSAWEMGICSTYVVAPNRKFKCSVCTFLLPIDIFILTIFDEVLLAQTGCDLGML